MSIEPRPLTEVLSLSSPQGSEGRGEEAPFFALDEAVSSAPNFNLPPFHQHQRCCVIKPRVGAQSVSCAPTLGHDPKYHQP